MPPATAGLGVLAAALLGVTTSVAPQLAAGAFNPGELLLLSTWLPDVGVGILRIDPLSGASALLVDLDINVGKTLTYDPYRVRLFFTDPVNHVIYSADDTGSLAEFLPGQHLPVLIAARGDGMLYLYDAGLPGFLYVDRFDVVHDLLDEAGAAPFGLPLSTRLNELIYDPASNALVVFQGTFNGVTLAGCDDPGAPCAVKIPLTPDGTQVAGPTVAAQADVSASPEVVVGAGVAPGGLAWVVDTNTNDEEPRMLLLDTATMTAGPYAWNGPYIGAASTNAGTFSTARGQVVIADTMFDVLRAYSAGGGGFGTAFAPGISSTGGGEFARLVEVTAGPAVAAPPGSGAQLDPSAAIAAPNPFRSATVLYFELPAPSWLDVGVYDLQGRRVRELETRTFAAGGHALSWDGRDRRGRSVAPGVYFVQIQGQRDRVVEKVVVQR